MFLIRTQKTLDPENEKVVGFKSLEKNRLVNGIILQLNRFQTVLKKEDPTRLYD